MPMEGVATALLGELRALGLEPAAWVISWARVLPTVLIVPAFGAGLLPLPLRLGIGAALSLSILPGVPDGTLGPPGGAPLLLAALGEAARGVPIAVTAALTLYAATVEGGLADTTLPGRRAGSPGPLSTLLGLAACVVFLETSGAERVLSRLREPPGPLGALGGALAGLRDLVAGLDLGVGLALPILAVALAVDVAMALARREGPGLNGLPVAALRTLAVLLASSLLLGSTLELLADRARAP